MKAFTYLALSLLKLSSALPLDNDPGASKDVAEKYIITLKPGVKVPELSGHLDWVEAVHKRSLEARGFDLGDLLNGKPGKGKGKGRKKHRGVEKVWKGNFKGYSGEFDKDTIAEIAKSRDVSTPAVTPSIHHRLVLFYSRSYTLSQFRSWNYTPR